MLNTTKIIISLALFGAGTFSTPIFAQNTSEMTAEEMAENFSKQKTRGLAIATPTTETATATGTTTAATPAVADAVATAIPKSEQVNINISFDFDSASVRPDQLSKLATLCSAILAAEVEMIRILGHTDSSGSAEYNQRLSKLRAEEVKRHLTADCGIAPNRMEAIGVGESFPYDQNDPKADVNRRVEFQALS